MVGSIYALKNKILQHVENETQDMNRIDVKEVGELVDMVKDLAEAEKSCWEAEYYKSVTKAMEGGKGDSMGYGGRMGYQHEHRDQMGAMGHDDIVSKLAKEYRSLPEDEKLMMKSRVLTTLGSM